MAVQQPCLTLNSGYKIPQVGLGTFMAAPNEVENAVLTAIDTGYRHIDCAHIYGNECEVGNALKKKLDDGTIKRQDVFITSKLWCDAHRLKDVRPACEESLRKLGLKYLDLYLVHWPVSFHVKEGRNFSRDDPDVLEYEEVPLEETWKGMEALVEAGLVRSIGVSNFNKTQIERILAICKIPPAVNQVEVSVNWLNEKMVAYAHSNGIQITAYAPFGSPGVMSDAPPLLEEEFVKKIASAHGKTPAQVLIRHAMQRNIIVIPKSTNGKRIESNFNVFDFALTTAEMETLKANSRNCRLFKIPSMAGHPEYPFNAEY